MASQKSERTALCEITNKNTGMHALSTVMASTVMASIDMALLSIYFVILSFVPVNNSKHLQHLAMRPNERGKREIENNVNTEQGERLRSLPNKEKK